jgi:C4-dicarboxylate transporter, DctQ subunit
MAVLAGALLCALTVLITVDVIGRKPGWFTISWTLDAAEYTLYIVTFFGAPWVLRDRGHIAIDIFVERLSPARRGGAAIAADALGAVVCAVLLYYSARVWWTSFSGKVMIYESFVLPEWWVMSVAPPTFVILLALFVRFLLARLPPKQSAGRPGAANSDGR